MPSTQIRTRQIADSAVTNAKIAAAAGIETSKLADGATFIRAGGTVAFTANQSMGGQKLTNLGTPTPASSDAARISDVEAAIQSLNSLFDSKGSVRAASTANVSIASPGAAIDGVSLVAGERILLKNQSAPAENGIYVWNGAAVPATRADDFNLWAEIPGSYVSVEEGTTNADSIYLSTANAGGTLGTTAITWQLINSVGYTASNFVTRETPTGLINGSNATYSLANTPVAGSEEVYLNGMQQASGGSNDYTISGATITMLTAPTTGETLQVSYRK